MAQGTVAYLDRTIVISELESVGFLDRFAVRREKKIRRHREAKEKKNELKHKLYVEKKRAKMQRHREHMAAKRAAEKAAAKGKEGEEEGNGEDEVRGGGRGG